MMRLLVVYVLVLSNVALQAHAADSIGRLFTKPNERAILNQTRQTKKEIVPVQAQEFATVVEPEVIQLPDTVSLQGYVKRTDGKKATIWVNHQAVQENTKNESITVGKVPANGNRVPIKLNASGKQFSLKAGQSYEPETNKVRESRTTVDGSATSGELSGGIIGDD